MPDDLLYDRGNKGSFRYFLAEFKARTGTPMAFGPTAAPAFLYIGQGLKADEFTAYVQGYDFGTIPPDFVVLHHTWKPYTVYTNGPNTGAWDDGEAGLSEADIYNRRKAKLDGIRDFYKNTNGWDRGPHLFIDDRYIWLFTPMREPGIHAMEGNGYKDAQGNLHYSIGIEVVGDYTSVPWPDPVAQLVGHAVAVLKRQLNTFELVYKPGPTRTPSVHVNSISGHRDYNKPTCPGNAVTEAFYISVLQNGWNDLIGAPPVPGPLTVNSPILGPATGTQEQAIAYIKAHLVAGSEYTGDVERIVGYYWEYALPVGVDPFLAVVQCIFETDSLNSYWAGRPRRNPAGLGVHEGEGLSFRDWNDSVQAHIGQLLAFALRDDQATQAQKLMMLKNPRFEHIPANLRGSAQKVLDLGGTWSTNPDYGRNMINRANLVQGL